MVSVILGISYHADVWFELFNTIKTECNVMIDSCACDESAGVGVYRQDLDTAAPPQDHYCADWL